MIAREPHRYCSVGRANTPSYPTPEIHNPTTNNNLWRKLATYRGLSNTSRIRIAESPPARASN